MLPNKKILQKNFFWILAFYWSFFNQKTAKIDQKLKKIGKIQTV